MERGINPCSSLQAACSHYVIWCLTQLYAALRLLTGKQGMIFCMPLDLANILNQKKEQGVCRIERKYTIPFPDRLIPKAGFTDILILTNPSLEIFYLQNSLLPPFNVMRFHNEVQIQSGRGRGHVTLILISLAKINNVVSFPETRLHCLQSHVLPRAQY